MRSRKNVPLYIPTTLYCVFYQLTFSKTITNSIKDTYWAVVAPTPTLGGWVRVRESVSRRERTREQKEDRKSLLRKRIMKFNRFSTVSFYRQYSIDFLLLLLLFWLVFFLPLLRFQHLGEKIIDLAGYVFSIRLALSSHRSSGTYLVYYLITTYSGKWRKNSRQNR